MNKKYILFAAIITLFLASCRTSAPNLDYSALARASYRLGMDIERRDNPELYIQASEWLGVPHRLGGNDKRGIDCSGLVTQLYRTVYGISLARNADAQRKNNCREIRPEHLHEGDLVFFHNGKNRGTASHVGIYLKNGNFIHTSSSKGVIISNLYETYYDNHWLCAGRVTK